MSEWIYTAITVTVAVGGWMIGSLSGSGAVATCFLGLAVAEGFGWKGLALLGAFFASSSFWSKFQSRKKEKFLEKIEKGDRRDFVQVLANGSVAAVVSLVSLFFPSSIWTEMFIVSLAAANADTWASEIGSLSKQAPRFILNGRKVEAGTSGAVTALGTIAAAGGALWIAFVSFLLWSHIDIGSVALFGFFGSIIDTVLGAVWQAAYRCSVCGLETEKTRHCGRTTKRIKGFRFINNDVVNWLAIMGATIMYVFVTKLQ